MKTIYKFGVGIAKDDKPWIVLYFIWNPFILHFLPCLDTQSTDREGVICFGWFFFNILLQVIKSDNLDSDL